MTRLKQWFFAGLGVLVPFVITAWVVVASFNLLDGWTKKLPFHFPGAGLVILFAVTILVGIAVRWYAGKRLHKLAEFVIERLPFVSLVYTTAKEVCTTLFGREKSAFQYVVMIEFCGQKMLGFVTGEAPLSIHEAVEPTARLRKVLSVFIPHAFATGHGYTVLVPEANTVRVSMSVEDALKWSLTGGMVKGTPTEADREAACRILTQETEAAGGYVLPTKLPTNMPTPIDCPYCGSKAMAEHDPRCSIVTGVYSPELAAERAKDVSKEIQ